MAGLQAEVELHGEACSEGSDGHLRSQIWTLGISKEAALLWGGRLGLTKK